MRKQTYQKPMVKVVVLQQQQLLAGSETMTVISNLENEDKINIEEEPQNGWGR